jgi:hypothetical protein
LNISSIRLVTKNPPQILTDEIKTDNEARNCGILCGKYPPPRISKPPTAVIPDMALVMDMRGVWRAGVTPQTEKYPVITESEKIVDMVIITGFVVKYPRPKRERIPPEKPRALLKDFLKSEV